MVIKLHCPVSHLGNFHLTVVSVTVTNIQNSIVCFEWSRFSTHFLQSFIKLVLYIVNFALERNQSAKVYVLNVKRLKESLTHIFRYD